MRVDIQSASISDLYALYQYVMGKANQLFGDNKRSKKIIQERLNEIEEELMVRAFGCNPYKPEAQPIIINGEDPKKVLESLPKSNMAEEAK